MKITTIIERIRFKINDVNSYRFTNEQILSIVNEAERFVRNIFFELRPELLTDNVVTGTLKKGQNVLQFDFIPMRYIDVRCGRRVLHAVHIREIRDVLAVGEPEVYTVVAKSAIAVYPIPTRDMTYSVSAVKGFVEQCMDDDSFFGDDYDDSLIEFAAMRLSMLDEFDESVEAQLLSEIRGNVERKLMNLTGGPHFVRGY